MQTPHLLEIKKVTCEIYLDPTRKYFYEGEIS